MACPGPSNRCPSPGSEDEMWSGNDGKEDETRDSKMAAFLEDKWVPMSDDELNSSRASRLARKKATVPQDNNTPPPEGKAFDPNTDFTTLSTTKLKRLNTSDLPRPDLAKCSAIQPPQFSQAHRSTIAIKRTQQLTISQVDETLQVVEQIRDELNKQEEPQVRKPRRKSPQGPSNLQRTDLRKFLWLHCAVLLGWSSKVKKFPRPATKGEKSEWGHPLRSLSTQDSNPYIHEAATPQQITIIKKMMHQAGIRRFAPNFMEPPNSNNNKFLWDLAIDVFVELIECSEYANVDVYLQQRNIVASELHKYVRETLARKYKKENLWNQDKQTSHTNAQKCKGRQSYLAEARLGTAAQIRGLECLYPVIKAATSEDAPLKNRKRGHKHCKVLAVPWRSSKITQVFIRLDKISAYQKEANFIKPSGPPPRIRRRLEHAAPGSVQSSARLPKNCYSSRWLEKLSTKQHQNIQPGPPCDLKKIMQQMPAVPCS
ncbi:hypothetical protein PtA15_7A384 [Puccinia triticina]|uniref:Uncharacterized protein n=1 Tax=Puccinia triticina TaxID=208348 RepID=A0ABY7CN58_9BASI|nr:uncharacterized protein PtA15_7A384 [Puccinia triticina]WAQ86656.1 hypothetical protein PtA15_7A384 [Puccinia triticina]